MTAADWSVVAVACALWVGFVLLTLRFFHVAETLDAAAHDSVEPLRVRPGSEGPSVQDHGGKPVASHAQPSRIITERDHAR